MRYASGKHARAICDRCGLEYKLHDLRKEWTNLHVCDECWEPKHPQLTVKGISDRAAVREPRPGNHSQEDKTVFLKGLQMHGFVGVISNDQTTTSEFLEPDGFESPFSLGNISLFIGTQLFPDGQQLNASIGSAVPSVSVIAKSSGFSVGTNVPNVGIRVDDSVTPPGLSTTFALGTPTIFINNGVWGLDAWGSGSWGQ